MEEVKERYVSKRVGELLRLNGFDLPTVYYYYKDSVEPYKTFARSAYNWNSRDVEQCSAPTVQVARDWLEEKYGFFIEISRSIDTNATYHYRYLIIDKLCNVVFKQHTDFLSSYETANAALECCLENLT
jgi:hypothetical protein